MTRLSSLDETFPIDEKVAIDAGRSDTLPDGRVSACAVDLSGEDHILFILSILLNVLSVADAVGGGFRAAVEFGVEPCLRICRRFGRTMFAAICCGHTKRVLVIRGELWRTCLGVDTLEPIYDHPTC